MKEGGVESVSRVSRSSRSVSRLRRSESRVRSGVIQSVVEGGSEESRVSQSSSSRREVLLTHLYSTVLTRRPTNFIILQTMDCTRVQVRWFLVPPKIVPPYTLQKLRFG